MTMPANPEPQPWTPEEVALEIAYHRADAARYPGQYRADKSLRLAATLSSYSRLLAQGEELQKDKERLDWLENSVPTGAFKRLADELKCLWNGSFREWIDAARSEGGKDG